jgi:hypothetical protein
MAVATSWFARVAALNSSSGYQLKSAQADGNAISRLKADFSYQPELQFKATLEPPCLARLYVFDTIDKLSYTRATVNCPQYDRCFGNSGVLIRWRHSLMCL